jgi:hypothetical protein
LRVRSKGGPRPPGEGELTTCTCPRPEVAGHLLVSGFNCIADSGSNGSPAGTGKGKTSVTQGALGFRARDSIRVRPQQRKGQLRAGQDKGCADYRMSPRLVRGKPTLRYVRRSTHHYGACEKRLTVPVPYIIPAMFPPDYAAFRHRRMPRGKRVHALRSAARRIRKRKGSLARMRVRRAKTCIRMPSSAGNPQTGQNPRRVCERSACTHSQTTDRSPPLRH